MENLTSIRTQAGVMLAALLFAGAGARADRGEQPLAQISLSKLIMSPIRCRIPDDRLVCFETIKFQAGAKWTESTP